MNNSDETATESEETGNEAAEEGSENGNNVNGSENDTDETDSDEEDTPSGEATLDSEEPDDSGTEAASTESYYSGHKKYFDDDSAVQVNVNHLGTPVWYVSDDNYEVDVNTEIPELLYTNGKFFQWLVGSDYTGGNHLREVKAIKRSNYVLKNQENDDLALYYIEYKGNWYPVYTDSMHPGNYYIRTEDKLSNTELVDNKYLYYDINPDDSSKTASSGNSENSIRMVDGWDPTTVSWSGDILNILKDDGIYQGVFSLTGVNYLTGMRDNVSGAESVTKETDEDGIITVTSSDGKTFITGWQNNSSVIMAESTKVNNIEVNPTDWEPGTPLNTDVDHLRAIVFQDKDQNWYVSGDGINAVYIGHGKDYDPDLLAAVIEQYFGVKGFQVISIPPYISEGNSSKGSDGTGGKNTRTDAVKTDAHPAGGNNYVYEGNSSSQWIYLDRSGKRVKSWQYIDGDWYYFDTNGILQHEWLKADGHTYYLDPDTGIRQSGWKTINREKYYFDKDGIMQTGWVEIDGKWYYFDENGVMVIGWAEIDSNWYYFDETGVMQVGWLTIEKKTYYLGTDGIRVSGKQTIDDKKYEFDEKGVLVKGNPDKNN